MDLGLLLKPGGICLEDTRKCKLHQANLFYAFGLISCQPFFVFSNSDYLRAIIVNK
jgi:hypothetical protein